MSKDPKKKKSAIDKIIMGAIIGTAVGSAIGAAAAPKKGEETRDIVKERAQQAAREAQEVGKVAKETGKGLWKLARILVGKGKRAALPSHEQMKEIPQETDIIPKEHVD